MGTGVQEVPNLAAIRRARGVTLEEIAQSTKIRTFYLEAIENGDLAKLPGSVYTRNYVRQYARAIDYDERDLLERYCLWPNESDAQGQLTERSRGIARLVRFMTVVFNPHHAASAGRRL